ncbi:predicted protein [Naegleria gruberi]|uniref:Predicted protein n=1 Tax=Naegleria gruberi TaxID=5762 RepID=D2VZZ6_NAEGR|nr:uncharacterized protein NAEGRDRAFT_74674 [Naegleria gruberi]EFC37617.1 predicted protein [Naegleria gruberi]|eukprot:XP_002670361.1 predicted protein [Naegleria gruberi strain NEG-M]
MNYCKILQLSQDILCNVIIPYCNSHTLIAFAGVCSEWRRIVKESDTRGIKCVNVKHKSARYRFESLNDEEEMSGLMKGDLLQIFSQMEIRTFPEFEETIFLNRSFFKKLFNSKKLELLTLQNTNIITIIIPAKDISPIITLKLISVQMEVENLRTICTNLLNLTDLTLIDNGLDYKATLVLTKSKLTRLTHLTLRNRIGDEGVNQLLTQPGNIRTLKHINFVARPPESSQKDNISYIAPINSSMLPNLESFSIDLEMSTKSIMNVLNSGNSWRELTFFHSHLNSECMKQIGKIHTLQKLCFQSKLEVDLPYRCLLPLQNNLTHLEIGPVDNNTFSELSEGNFVNLKYLCILNTKQGNEIDEYVIRKFCEKVQNLTYLELRRVVMKSGCMNHISQLSKITDLRIIQTHIDSEEMKYLSRMSNLTTLYLGSEITFDGISYLCNGNLLNLHTLKFTRVPSGKFKYDSKFTSSLAHSNFPKLRYLSFYYEFDIYATDMLHSGPSLKNLIHLELYWVDLTITPILVPIVNNLAPKYLTGIGGFPKLKAFSPEAIPQLRQPTKINYMTGHTDIRIDEFI